MSDNSMVSGFEKTLHNAAQHLGVAMSEVDKASRLARGFENSKPLNILYKELRAGVMLLDKYLGKVEKLPSRGYEVPTPTSINTYINLNRSEKKT
jgi:hypothetical protein